MDVVKLFCARVFFSICYSHGSNCEALRLRVHLILFYFGRISPLNPEILVYLDGGGRGEETFLLFNFSLNNLVYTFAIGVCLYKIYLCTFIFMGFYIFNKLNIKFQK